jgi:hypothetical protein
MSSAGQSRLRSLADFIIRYDLALMREEVRIDFNPEVGSQRLLKQSEISARFRKKAKVRNRV